MNQLNYTFFEEFKRLDKLCGEIYGSQHGVSHYIDDMKAASANACFGIPNWNADLKQLVQLRHIRNHLAHTENAFDEETCSQEDIAWVQNFHHRIMTQSDPLALLHQHSRTEKPASVSQPLIFQIPSPFSITDIENNTTRTEDTENFNWLLLIPVIFLFIAIVGVVLLVAFGITILFL